MTMLPSVPSTPPQILVGFGNVSATQEWVITPAGSWPSANVNVTSQDQTSTTTHTPAWAIILCVIFIWFFLLSLLFLLAKETRVSGYVAVHIQAGGQSFTEQIPVWSAAHRADVLNRVGYLQSLIGQARWVEGQRRG